MYSLLRNRCRQTANMTAPSCILVRIARPGACWHNSSLYSPVLKSLTHTVMRSLQPLLMKKSYVCFTLFPHFVTPAEINTQHPQWMSPGVRMK